MEFIELLDKLLEIESNEVENMLDHALGNVFGKTHRDEINKIFDLFLETVENGDIEKIKNLGIKMSESTPSTFFINIRIYRRDYDKMKNTMKICSEEMIYHLISFENTLDRTQFVKILDEINKEQRDITLWEMLLKNLKDFS